MLEIVKFLDEFIVYPIYGIVKEEDNYYCDKVDKLDGDYYRTRYKLKVNVFIVGQPEISSIECSCLGYQKFNKCKHIKYLNRIAWNEGSAPTSYVVEEFGRLFYILEDYFQETADTLNGLIAELENEEVPDLSLVNFSVQQDVKDYFMDQNLEYLCMIKKYEGGFRLGFGFDFINMIEGMAGLENN